MVNCGWLYIYVSLAIYVPVLHGYIKQSNAWCESTWDKIHALKYFSAVSVSNLHCKHLVSKHILNLLYSISALYINISSGLPITFTQKLIKTVIMGAGFWCCSVNAYKMKLNVLHVHVSTQHVNEIFPYKS